MYYNNKKPSPEEIGIVMNITNNVHEIIKKSNCTPTVSNIYHKINKNEINNKIIKNKINYSKDNKLEIERLINVLLNNLNENRELLNKLDHIKNNNIETVFKNFNNQETTINELRTLITDIYDKNDIYLIDLKKNNDEKINTLTEVNNKLQTEINQTEIKLKLLTVENNKLQDEKNDAVIQLQFAEQAYNKLIETIVRAKHNMEATTSRIKKATKQIK